MRQLFVKLAVSAVLIPLAGTLLFLCMRWDHSPAPAADFFLPVLYILLAMSLGVVAVMFLPADIQRRPVRARLLYAVPLALVLVGLTMAAFLGAALLLGPFLL